MVGTAGSAGAAADRFSDITDASVHQPAVEALADEGIVEGTECAPGMFCPGQPIRRWVMAVWLVRAVDNTDPAASGSSRFSDVDASEWWAPYVERLAELRITRGCATEPARFCPNKAVTRAQMASLIVRALQLAPGPPGRFADIDESSHAAAINALTAAGITAGCAVDPARYCPSADTTRSQMATFLARGLGLVATASVDGDDVTGRGPQPDPAMCRPPGRSSGTTAGFPLPWDTVPSVGRLRVAVLFVDFPDAQATRTTHEEAAPGLPGTEAYLETVSYGKLDVRFTPLHRWLRAEHNYHHYLEDVRGTLKLYRKIDAEAVRLADPVFDFAGHDAVMIVMPSSHFSDGNSTGTIITDEGTISTLRINTSPSQLGNPRWGGRLGAHELAHNLGLPDLYAIPSRPPPDATKSGIWARTSFGLMSMEATFLTYEEDPRIAHVWRHPDGSRSTAYDYSFGAVEMLAWSRWLVGWLEPTQVRCVTEPEATVTLSPIADPGPGMAMVAIPLSETEVIVVESRRKLGYDTGEEYEAPDGWHTTFPGLATEGVLVYTVDAAIGTGDLPLKVAGDNGDGIVDAYPILTDGQSVATHGYTITVESSTSETHIVTIARTDSR